MCRKIIFHIVNETKLAVHDASRGTVRAETGTKWIPKCYVYMAPDDVLETEGTTLFYYYLIPCCEERSVNVHSDIFAHYCIIKSFLQ